MLERLRTLLETRYQVTRELGTGGMATVFLATDLKHNRRVAIKVLRPDLAAGVGPERFLREIGIAAMLQHPHIVPVYDSGQTDGLLYYVMPFVEGESLRDRLIREGPLPPAEAARIAREVADALAYAHKQGIVHRDIKPANILLSQGHAVVADFGIARALTTSGDAQLTQGGVAVGTPSYMSPEQAFGETAIDGRTDVYALGVVLYETLAGSPPFRGTTPQAVVAQVLSRPVPKLSSDPVGLQAIIERAMAKEPTDRFATAEQLCAALDAVTSGSGFRIAPRKRARIVVAAGCVVAAVALGAWWSRGHRTADPRRSLIVFPFENKTGDPTRDYLGDAAMNLLGLAAAHWQDMRVYDDERTMSFLHRRKVAGPVDFDQARAMAREADVGTLIIGDLRHEADSLVVAVKVHDVRSGERLTTILGRAAWTADPRPLFDTLASEILGTSGAPPGERPSVVAQTTSSLEAYRAYLAGTSALQRFQIDSARALLTHAVSLDSDFALAYIRLRDVDGWSGPLGSDERRNAYILAAERHGASLPPRLRALIAFHRAFGAHDYQRARRTARDLIKHDSTDVEAWYQLGEAHYHDGSSVFPHPDSLGNLGLALRAFQRALRLDSSYVLAYQHIVDALGSCSEDSSWVCGKDSAVYGSYEQLVARFGAAHITLRRDSARADRLETGRAWVSAVPGSPRPRQLFVRALYEARRYDEALREISAMERLGWVADAAFLKASVLFRTGHVDEAASAIEDGLRSAHDSLTPFLNGVQHWSVPSLLLAGAGRVAAGRRLNAALFRSVPVDSASGPGNMRFARADLERLSDALLPVEAGTGAAVDLRQIIGRYAHSDTTAERRLRLALGATILSVFLVTRDTTELSALARDLAATPSSPWRVVDAQLALARGDSTRARLQADVYVRGLEDTFGDDGGVIRAFAWGDLLARLDRSREAIAAYGRLDSLDQNVLHPGFLVRSWAERGTLYEQLHQEKPQAVEWYERFVGAWHHCDAELRPRLQRARVAIQKFR